MLTQRQLTRALPFSVLFIVLQFLNATCHALPQEEALRFPTLTNVVADDGKNEITFSWWSLSSEKKKAARYRIFRRDARGAAPQGWGPFIAETREPTYTDKSVSRGVLYEYAVAAEPPNATGWTQGGKKASKFISPLFFLAGLAVPPTGQLTRGNVLLLVEDTLATALDGPLRQYREDLVTEGYRVLLEKIPAAPAVGQVGYKAAVVATKQLILSLHKNIPGGLSQVLLVGDAAIPFSGLKSPDGYALNAGAFPTDIFYGDVDVPVWPDLKRTGKRAKRSSARANLPGDGKFDISNRQVDKGRGFVRSAYSPEILVSRIFFSSPPQRGLGAGRVVSPAAESARVAKYQDYFKRNHLFRTSQLKVSAKGIIYDDYLTQKTPQLHYYGRHGMQGFPQLVGAENATFAKPGKYLRELSQGRLVLTYGAGEGRNTGMSGLGSTSRLIKAQGQAVFNFIYGGNVADWTLKGNPLPAFLQGKGLISAIVGSHSGSPSIPPDVFPIHRMAGGESIGSVLLRYQQHDPNDYPVRFDMAPVYSRVPLISSPLGDTTLRLEGDEATTSLKAEVAPSAAEVLLTIGSQQSDAAIALLRSKDADGPYALVATLPPGTTQYRDQPGRGTWHYMSRGIVPEKRAGKTCRNYHGTDNTGNSR